MLSPPFGLVSRPRLPALGLLKPPLGFNFLRGVGLPRLHSFLTFVLPLPFMIGRVDLGMLGKWRNRELGLGLRSGESSMGYFRRCFSPKLGFKQLLKVDLGLPGFPSL